MPPSLRSSAATTCARTGALPHSHRLHQNGMWLPRRTASRARSLRSMRWTARQARAPAHTSGHADHRCIIDNEWLSISIQAGPTRARGRPTNAMRCAPCPARLCSICGWPPASRASMKLLSAYTIASSPPAPAPPAPDLAPPPPRPRALTLPSGAGSQSPSSASSYVTSRVKEGIIYSLNCHRLIYLIQGGNDGMAMQHA